MAAGILPSRSKKCSSSPTILGIANSFSGGVFLAIALIHILPEASDDYKEQYGDKSFPLPFLLVFVGYAFILSIDKVAFDSHAAFDHDEHQHHVDDPAEKKLQEAFTHNSKSISNAKKSGNPDMIRQSMINQKEDIRKSMADYLKRSEKFSVRMSAAVGHKSHAKTKTQEEQKQLFIDSDNININQAINDDDCDSCDECEDFKLVGDYKSIKEKHKQHTHVHRWEKKNKCGCNLTPFILMIALSIHAIFEGIALGLNKNMSATINIVIAVFLHKWAAAMSLGISLAKTFPDNPRFILLLVLTFSCATPLGVTIGIILTAAPPIVDIAFSSLAGGTFLYIACSEVIVEEFSVPGHRWLKYFAFLIGCAIITSLFFIESG